MTPHSPIAKESAPRRAPVPTWKIWANPIVRRYARSRLRPSSLGFWLLLAVLIAGFLFLSIRAGFSQPMTLIDYARAPIIPLLVLQGIILFVLGTGQVAGAMTAEADEGVLDYQRLAPMTPLSKVLGYLFGLPIREWILFLATMPFTIISFWQGEIPWQYGVQLYAVFVMAAILYHLTGLLTGTVMKNRRWAFLGSMGSVFLLYTVIPQAAKFGLVYFKYLTVYPVVEEVLPHLMPRIADLAIDAFRQLAPQAKFFALNLPQYAVTLVSQAVLCFALIIMLWRRWRKSDSHLLGKFGAVGLFSWLQVVLLGNALPLIEGGDIFPSREIRRRFGRILNPDSEFWRPQPQEALVMIGLFGTVTLVFLWWMTFLITPVGETQVRGWRRARKFGKTKLPVLSDAATSAPWVCAMTGIGIFGWHTFSSAILDSKWYPDLQLAKGTLLAMILVFLCGGFAVQAILESKGRKVAGFAAILLGIVPIMISVILGATGPRLTAPAVWVAGICPVSWPIYGAGVFVPDGGLPRDIARALPYAFWFWQGVSVLLVSWLLIKLRAARIKISRESMD